MSTTENLSTDLRPQDEAAETTAPFAVNTATKTELLNRAKAAVEAGDQSMHDAAEALSSHRNFTVPQVEMARAVGKSEAWISLLLQWRRAGHKAESPFGPTTKEARLKHAKDRAASGTSKPRKSRKASTEPEIDADEVAASAEERKAKYAKTDPGPETSMTTTTGARRRLSALEQFKYAVNIYVPKMDEAAKNEAAAYFAKKAGAAVS